MKAVVLILVSMLYTSSGLRYGFYKTMAKADVVDGTRRVFGGARVDLEAFPSACLLTDKNWYARCSGAIVASHWVLTAAHCIEGSLAYIKYNTMTPLKNGDYCNIVRLFRHPEYQVLQEDEGRGMDVTQLHHDVGLVKTSHGMVLKFPQAKPLIRSREITPGELQHVQVTALGFGRTEEEGSLGEKLFGVKLELQPCERISWFHCVCGLAGAGQRARGVCSGDSGGPVIFNGTQVGVTSMGPIVCMNNSDLPATATSVFTVLYNYVDIVESTIHELKDNPVMRQVAIKNCAERLMMIMSSYIMIVMFLWRLIQ